jgi:8-oxo-dGTP diphosphatase
MGEDYPRIDVTVDVVALTEVDGETQLLVVRRGSPPFEGRWAFPGGYLEVDEDLAPAAARELQEETGIALEPDRLRQLGAYGAPDRDPRGRTVSVAFLVELDDATEATGGDDAAEAQWRPVADVEEEGLAFDHASILRDALARRSGSRR